MCARARISVCFLACARVGMLDMSHVHSAIWSTCYPQDDLLLDRNCFTLVVA